MWVALKRGGWLQRVLEVTSLYLFIYLIVRIVSKTLRYTG